MIVELDGLVFNDDIPDPDGTLWYVTGLEGWDSPGLRQSVVAPTSRHGGVVAVALLDARALVLKGIVKATSTPNFWKAWHGLQGQTNNIYDTKTFRVTEGAVERESGVVRAGNLRYEMLGMNAFQFELPLTAPDPLKYDPNPVETTLAAGATVTLTNNGSFVTERVTLTASANGHVNVVNNEFGDRGVVTNQEVPAATTFDALTRDVRSPEGRNLYGNLSPMSSWWGLQPGENSIKNWGTETVYVTHYHAWL
jgi:hypothetical protein